MRHGGGDVDPLQHAARKLAGTLRLMPGKPELAQYPGGIEPDAAGDLLSEPDVVDRALPRQYGRALRDETE